jgi:hypothetical protein
MKVRHYGRMAVLSMGCMLLLAPGIARAEHTKLFCLSKSGTLKSAVSGACPPGSTRLPVEWVRLMSNHTPKARTYAAALMLCVLAIASVGAPICPACSQLDLPSPHPIAFNSADHDSGPDCDRDGCSCCGFQIVAAPRVSTQALTEFTWVPESSSESPRTTPLLAVYHPPRG